MTLQSKVMDYPEFLDRILRAGLASLLTHESLASHPEKLAGSRAGFEACRGKSPEELAELLQKAGEERLTMKRNAVGFERPAEYWYKRYFELQVEHVCNTVAARIFVSDEASWRTYYARLFPTSLPTTRGVNNAARILGVAKW
jgi:hypothetical protein